MNLKLLLRKSKTPWNKMKLHLLRLKILDLNMLALQIEEPFCTLSFRTCHKLILCTSTLWLTSSSFSILLLRQQRNLMMWRKEFKPCSSKSQKQSISTFAEVFSTLTSWFSLSVLQPRYRDWVEKSTTGNGTCSCEVCWLMEISRTYRILTSSSYQIRLGSTYLTLNAQVHNLREFLRKLINPWRYGEHGLRVTNQLNYPSRTIMIKRSQSFKSFYFSKD